MSAKRKGPTAKSKAKARKVEYDEDDISSEHDSDAGEEALDGVDGDGPTAEDDLVDLSGIPELPAPEVNLNSNFYFYCINLL